MRLLVVEDDNYLAQSLNMALEEQGYSTEIACDGQQAILALANNSYDLVVLDLNLPYLDGMEDSNVFEPKDNPHLCLFFQPETAFLTESQD